MSSRSLQQGRPVLARWLIGTITAWLACTGYCLHSLGQGTALQDTYSTERKTEESALKLCSSAQYRWPGTLAEVLRQAVLPGPASALRKHTGQLTGNRRAIIYQ